MRLRYSCAAISGLVGEMMCHTCDTGYKIYVCIVGILCCHRKAAEVVALRRWEGVAAGHMTTGLPARLERMGEMMCHTCDTGYYIVRPADVTRNVSINT